MSRKAIEVGFRVPGKGAVNVAGFDRLEAVAEAMGNGVAGQRPHLVEASEPAKPQAEPVRGTRGIVARKGRILADGSRRGKRDLRRVTVYLPPDLAQKLSRHCFDSQRQISDFVAEAVTAALAGR